MADIAPLRPLRYAAKDLSTLVAPPYDVISPSERLELMSRSPHNVVRLILPDGEGDAKYAHAASVLESWRKEGALVRDDQPAFYRYDQTFEPPGGGARRTRRGFLALVRVVPFEQRVVLPHERTLSGPKEDRLKLFRATRTNLSPGFMLYRDPGRELDGPLETGELIASFATPDGVDHKLAKVAGADAMRAIVDHIAKSSLLIADGHHRYETALAFLKEHPGADAGIAESPVNVLATLIDMDDEGLTCFPTHRVIRDKAPVDPGSFPLDLFEVKGYMFSDSAREAKARILCARTFPKTMSSRRKGALPESNISSPLDPS